MSHYQQSLVLEANPTAVYAALTTSEGLRGWWTRDCDVATKVGETIHFRFAATQKDMRIERLEPGREVAWLCTGAHIAVDSLACNDEWVGTRLVFRLKPDGEGRTRLDFEHVGLVPELECFAMCNDGWRHFLSSLQKYVATGTGTPHEVCGAGTEAKPETSTESTDSIQRNVVINAPRERVWSALTDAEKFGTWFGANLKGQTFAAGQRARGQITIPGYQHIYFDVLVERIEPQNLMSYRWHPYAMDPEVDYTKEEPTLVTFTLKDSPNNGTLLTVVESGFDKVPPHRRLEAFRMNSNGWDGQIRNIVRYVTA